MVFISEMPLVARGFISNLEPPVFENLSWVKPKDPKNRRISIVSTAGIHNPNDKPYSWKARNHRVFDKKDLNLVMSHVAVEYDRTAWQQDLNTILPTDRLNEMADRGEIGSVADKHYSFLGSSDPLDMKKSVDEVAGIMKQEEVDTVFLIPI